jgi:hypothetical protein
MDGEGNWLSPDGDTNGDECVPTIRRLTRVERQAWFDGMLTEECPVNRGRVKAGKYCKRIGKRLKKIADL